MTDKAKWLLAVARPTFDETFVSIAEVVSRRGTCPMLQVGAVLVDSHNRIVGSGYNGSAAGLQHCTDVGCDKEDTHCTRAVHAEINALLNSSDLDRARGGTFYIYGAASTCYRCAQAIISAGVVRVVCAPTRDDDGRYHRGAGLLREAGIEFIVR